MGDGATFHVPENGFSVFPCQLDYRHATTPDKTFEVFGLDPHVSNSLAMNIFSCYNSSKSTFFYPRHRLEALKKGHRRHQLLLSLGSPNNSSQFPTAPLCISEVAYAPEDEDDDGGADGSDGVAGWSVCRVPPTPCMWSTPA